MKPELKFRGVAEGGQSHAAVDVAVLDVEVS